MEVLTGAPATLECGLAGSGVADAVLREVARLLDALAQDPGFTEAVDLHSLPMSDTDRERLQQRLGRGEIEAALDLAGPTRITETAYAGVWWVRHADADDRAVLEQIVVAQVPALLLAHRVDIADAACRLATELDAACRQETLNG
jgi:hydrogenase-1 operon protein HyaF